MIDSMTTRHYIIDRIKGLGNDGRIKIAAKNIPKLANTISTDRRFNYARFTRKFPA